MSGCKCYIIQIGYTYLMMFNRCYQVEIKLVYLVHEAGEAQGEVAWYCPPMVDVDKGNRRAQTNLPVSEADLCFPDKGLDCVMGPGERDRVQGSGFWVQTQTTD